MSASEDTEIRDWLGRYRRIHVVGLSDKPERASFGVAQRLQRLGYEIVPVNPNIARWQGLRAYPSLSEAPGPFEIVDVFRRSELVMPVVVQAAAVGAKLVWLQEGVTSDEAARYLAARGIPIVQDRCLAVLANILRPEGPSQRDNG
jgi:predicted CoA-binding protein